jgi:protoheme IX farnesyltransferase
VTMNVSNDPTMQNPYREITQIPRMLRAPFARISAQLRNQSLNNQCNLRNLRISVSPVLQEALKTEIAFQPELRPSLQVKTITRTAREFLTLAKPEITLMVMISAGFSCLMASDFINLIILTHAVLGTGLVAAGATSLNQFMERAVDGNMRRTSKRPLPSGKLTARAAFVFGVSLSAVGTIYLIYFLNTLTALLGLLTLCSYLFVNTPLKRKTRLCTLVGAFPGAAPILMGWAAAKNNLGLEAWALYAILLLWQFPHFYAIGWLYREDYARAGMLMLPSLDENDERTVFEHILVSTQLLFVASLLPALIAHTGTLYFASAMILGISFYYFAYQAAQSRSKAGAKRLLHASVIYLPLLYLFMLLDKIIR